MNLLHWHVLALSCFVQCKIECNAIPKWTTDVDTKVYRINNTLLLNIRIIFLSPSRHFNPFKRLFVVCDSCPFSFVMFFLRPCCWRCSKVFERICDFSQNLKLHFLPYIFWCEHIFAPCSFLLDGILRNFFKFQAKIHAPFLYLSTHIIIPSMVNASWNFHKQLKLKFIYFAAKIYYARCCWWCLFRH